MKLLSERRERMEIIMAEIIVTKQDLRLFFDMIIPPSTATKKDENGEKDWRTILFEAVLLAWYNELERRQDHGK